MEPKPVVRNTSFWVRYIFLCATMVAALMGAIPSVAQETTRQPWTALPGRALDIAINDAAQAYAVSRSGEALRWRAADQRWSRMSGEFVRITGAEGNRPWAVTDKGVVMRYNGLWWEVKGEGVVDVAGDARGNVLIARIDGSIQRWEPLSGNWRTLSGQAKRIALDDAGQPWVIAPDDQIYRFDISVWQPLPGRARDIAIGGNGKAVIVDAEGNVREWRPELGRWDLIPSVSGVRAVAVTPNGNPWVVREDGTIMASVLIKTEDVLAEVQNQAPAPQAPLAQAPSIVTSPIVAPAIQANTSQPTQPKATTAQAPNATAPNVQAPSGASDSTASSSASTSSGSESPSRGSGGSGDPAATSTADDLKFTDTRATSAHVEIGKDGSVFVLITGGTIQRWSNERRRLEDFPGQLARLAIDTDGNPWGVTSLGRVFRHDGQNWKQIAGATASDIAVGADGTIVTADANSSLAKFNPTTNRFDRINGRGIQVAVAPDGTPWTIRDDSVVQKCDKTPCTPVNRLARNISIGPDGSVFIVTTQDQLQRLLPGKDSFEQVLTPGHTPSDVGVGPNGFPWVVSTEGKLLATRFFVRDESADQTLALKTSSDTSGAGATAAVVSSQNASSFTFTKNLKFDSFKSSDPDANLAQIFGIAVGQDNSVFIHDNSNVFEFNVRKEKFEALTTTFPASIEDVSTDADGVIWGLSNSTPAKVYRIKGTQVKTYTVISSTDTNTPRNMAVDGDGTVYVALGQVLYRKIPSSSTFKEFSDDSIYNVALAGGGDIWILNQSFKVQQWTGTKFENRPKGTGQTANDIAAGADGTVYVINSNKLLRWNATNSEFDEVNSTNITASFDKVAVTNQGRPWAANTSSGGDDVFRARD